MSNYSNPEVLVSTEWVAEHYNSPGIRLIEVDVDTHAYDAGHIPGSVGFNWELDLNNPVQRDIVSKADFEKLLSAAGVEASDTIIYYGDNNNWFAAFAFWISKYYGHQNLRLMNGGRKKWLDEDRELTTEKKVVTPSSYQVTSIDRELRAMLPEVIEIAANRSKPLVDVRSPDEFSGKIIAPPNLPETAQRGGHIPGAKNVPWSKSVDTNGAFKSADELKELYLTEQGLNPETPTVAYCRIGERSSHTWFVLKYLLGFKDVKNYDGSWTEYGNLVRAVIER